MKMMPEFPFAVPDRLLSIADLLAEQGWAVAESGLAPEVLDQLERNCHALWQDEALRPAAVGRAGERQVVPEIRGDHIRWLDDCPPCAAQDAYVEAMARLRLTRSEEHTSELQSRPHLVCRLLLEKKKQNRETPQSLHSKHAHLKQVSHPCQKAAQLNRRKNHQTQHRNLVLRK